VSAHVFAFSRSTTSSALKVQCAAVLCALAVLAVTAADPASARIRWHHCGFVRTGVYYRAGSVAASRISCRRARRVARVAAHELATVGVGNPYNFGFVVFHKTWGCWWKEGVGSDSVFRVHCGPQDSGSARVDFSARPGE
jgi:hypothetical protein